MILQELYRYYERKSDEMPSHGYSAQKIRFALIIDLKGNLIDVEDREIAEEQNKGKKSNKRVDLVISPSIPERSGKSAYKSVGFIVENSDYILGNLEQIASPEKASSYEQKLNECFEATNDGAIQAILAFVDKTKNADFDSSKLDLILKSKINPIIGFKLDELKSDWIWKRNLLKEWYAGLLVEENPNEEFLIGDCLITGMTKVKLARLQGSVKIGIGQTSGVSLVSFNQDAFDSYGKKQAYNAPVSLEAASKYHKALEMLTNAESKNKVRLGENVYVFWAEKNDKEIFESTIHETISGRFDLSEEEEPSEEDKKKEEKKHDREAVESQKKLLEKSSTGNKDVNLDKFTDDKTKFYVLGLTANAARLAVSSWYQESIGELASTIQKHYDDIKIEGMRSESPPIWFLLKSLVRKELKELPPKLIPDLMQAILRGTAYPHTLLNQVINRCKAEQKIDASRASLLKAYYARLRRRDPQIPNIKVTMDENEINTSYRLGRLFATLEKAQEDASDSKINSTIRDRYYSSASANPAIVFPTLLRLSMHHQSDLRKNKPNSRNFSKLIAEILQPIEVSKGGFPSSLSLQEQGLFALGYYQQRQSFFQKKELDTSEPNTNQGEENQ